MRLFCVVGVIGLLLAAAANAAPTIRNANDIGPGDLPRTQVLSSDDAGVSFLIELPTLSVEEITVGSQAFQVLAIPGGGLTGDVGSPGIPTFARFVSIPDGVGYTVDAVPEDEVELPGYRLMPVQGEDGTAFAYDAAAYARVGFASAQPALAGRPAISRDLRVVPVTIQPVEYDPSRGIVRVAQRMRVEVRFTGQDPENATPARRATIPPSFDRLYRELVVNYSGPPAGVEVRPGQYVLICPNNNDVVSRLQPLVDWRRRMGYAVRLATTAETGTTKESIKAFIQNLYDNGAVPLEYVCLVGDASGNFTIPTWHENLSYYYGEGDHEYTLLAGGDVLSDIHVGRLSISSLTDLETEVAKIVGYETTPEMQDPSWFKRACLVGDPNSSGYSCVQVQQWIKERLRDLGYAQVDTVFSNFVTGMTTSLNRGVGLFSYRGYWNMSGWTNSNTNSLTNGWKMPFVVTITCDTGSFESDGSCRSEGFLRAGTAQTPKGAVGAIGTATTGTHTRFNNCIHVGIFYGLLYAGQTTMGSALTRGKYDLYLNYQTVDPNRVYIWSVWNNLMGDPAVDIYQDTPLRAFVDYPSTIPIGTNAVSLFVHEQGDTPIPDALVCLYKGTETFSTGYTGPDGRVELPVNAATGGNMLVTVTRHNLLQYSGLILVSSASRYVAYQGSTIVDDGSGSSVGNGDAVLNPGETIELPIQVKNFGSQSAPGVTGILSSSDPYVTVLVDSESFGDIGAGASAWSQGNYLFRIEPTCPNGHAIRFSLDLQSGTDQWHSIIDALDVVSADLEAVGYTIDGNGRIDPGETVRLSVKLKNVGGNTAVSPTATLMTMSEFVDTPDQTGTYSTIAPNGMAENTSDTFAIHAAPETYQGYVATLQLLLDFSGGVKDTAYVQIPVGSRSSDDPIGPDAYGYYAFDDTDVSYPEHPTYDWIELDPAQGGSGGTEITLGDFGNEMDKSRTIDTPFPIVYYGQPFQKATVCSNGWITMGSTYLTDYRNWFLPSGNAIDNMIAVFWEELYQISGTSKAFHRYDSAEHRWIVEWSRFRDLVTGGTQTFEVIFYDPAYVTTETGDAKFLFQYKDVSGTDSDGYFTTGFQNADHTSGLTYSYFNQYPPGAAQIQTGRAIMVVPTREVIAGQIRGTVTNQTAGGAPLPEATIRVLESGHEYTTGADGSYNASEAQGTYTVTASHPSFAPDTVSNVVVTIGNSTIVDFSLRDILAPEITHTPIVTTSDTIGPYVARASISDYSPLAETTLYYRVNGGEFTAVPMTNQIPGIYTAQIPGQHWTSTVEYYIYARDVGDNAGVSPPGAPAVCYVFYVAPQIPLYVEEMEFATGWTAGAPGDNATTGIWENCDPNGSYWGQEPVQPEDDHTPDGTRCWVTGNAPPGAPQDQNDVDGGKTTLTSPRFNLDVAGIVVLRYYRWFTNNTGNNPNEDPWIVQISDDDGEIWHTLESTTETDRSWRLMEFDLSNYINFTDQVRIRFSAADFNGPSVVEAGIDDLAILVTGLTGADVEQEGGDVRRFDLAQNRPNPFNPRTVIRFSLEKSGPASLTIFDVSGRIVRRLVNGTTAAGSHAVVWDGLDDTRHAAPSGIYLYRLDAGVRSDTKKMILLQ